MKNIIFDFDGVIIDSLSVREFGFREIFKNFENDKVEELIAYHKINGGWSRFVKIRYFFEKLLFKQISNDEVLFYASKYSEIMKKTLVSKDIIIQDTLNFIKKYYKEYNFHIASGSEQNELRYLNKELGLDIYFKSIYGSPTPKIEIVHTIMSNNAYNHKETLLIGDSINDYEAALKNNLLFFGYNNIELKNIGSGYIKDFYSFEKEVLW